MRIGSGGDDCITRGRELSPFQGLSAGTVTASNAIEAVTVPRALGRNRWAWHRAVGIRFGDREIVARGTVTVLAAGAARGLKGDCTPG